MDERHVQQILIEILYSALNERACSALLKESLSADALAEIYRLAKVQDLAQIVSQFVYQNQIEATPELKTTLQREEIMAVYRCEQLKYALREISSAFDVANIAYVPLKGSVVRPYYPDERMRTSCDVDILIHEEDLNRAVEALECKGYCCGKRNYHDVSLYSPNQIHLELHFNIQENMDRLDAVLKRAWEYTVPTEGSGHAFQKEFFVFHMYAHMAYHFLSGGCGIRPLMDIWIMEHKMDASYTCAEGLLKEAGIYPFAAEMSRISNLCFSKNAQDDFSELVLRYIYSGGLYGTKRNKIAMQKRQVRSALGFVLKKVCLPYKNMVILFPILKKAPFLLPFFWVIRGMRGVLKGKTKRFASEVVYAGNLPEDRVVEIQVICSRLGL